jgi:hypothetical protein
LLDSTLAQEKPAYAQVVAAIKKQQTPDHHGDMPFYQAQEGDITYIPGKFTGLNRAECLISYPSVETGQAGEYTFLMYKSPKGTWSRAVGFQTFIIH